MNKLLEFFKTHRICTEITENRISLQGYEEDNLKLKISIISISEKKLTIEIQETSNILSNYHSKIQNSDLSENFISISPSFFRYKDPITLNFEIEMTFVEIVEIIRNFVETAKSVINSFDLSDLTSIFPKNHTAFILDRDLNDFFFGETPSYFEEMIALMSYDDEYYEITLIKKEVIYSESFDKINRVHGKFDINSNFKQNFYNLTVEFYKNNYSTNSISLD